MTIKGDEGTVRHDIFLKADDALRRRILKRVGKTAGDVRIEQAEWDFGFCDTCSWPRDGLAVHVDGEQVWPNPEVLAYLGGNQMGDDAAHYGDGVVRVTQYSLFYDWLLGATPEELGEIEAKVWEEGDDDGD